MSMMRIQRPCDCGLHLQVYIIDKFLYTTSFTIQKLVMRIPFSTEENAAEILRYETLRFDSALINIAVCCSDVWTLNSTSHPLVIADSMSFSVVLSYFTDSLYGHIRNTCNAGTAYSLQVTNTCMVPQTTT
jgi:uncharacterized Rmd1/YagE family protein